MRSLRSLLLIVFVFVSTSLLAERRAIPTLSVEGDDGSIALELSALEIRVTIRGHLARTEYELTYRNSLERVAGGEFHFPLPADAEVSDLGLYFDGKLRHGVAVERVLARTAYEETVHRAVDPALVEWSSGRGFKLSVYPIPAKGEKKVFIAYDQELTASGYTLDLRYGKAMQFDATIDADGRELQVDGSLRFAREGGVDAMHTRGETIDGMVHVAREERETALLAYVPEDKLWYASAAVDVRSSGSELAPAANVVIFYDTSSSSVQQNAALLRRFLTSFLARQQAWATANVIPFHIALETPRRIENAGMPAGQREVERVLGDLQPLGATNLFAVISQLSAITAPLPPSTRIVLVTDGLTSLGDSRDVAAALAKLSDLRRPLLVVNAASTADDQVLGNAARATGGWSIDLTRTDPEAAAAAAMRLPASVRFPSGILPSAVVTAGGERIAVAARANDSLIKLPHDLPPREIRESGLVRRAWARAKLREMLANGAPDEELIAHGRAFTQLTPRTSLLVLESWRDYVQYDIPMPPDVVEEKAREERERNEPRPTGPPLPLPPPQVTPGTWFIKGRVLDSYQTPLPGVTVVLRDGDVPLSMDVTGAEGRFLLSHASAPANPNVIADLPGYNRIEREFSNDTPSGAALDVILKEPAVSESITVTASAPAVEPTLSNVATTIRPSLLTSSGGMTTDQLLNKIAAGDVPAESESDDPEVLEAVAKQRLELTRQVIAKLRAIGSTSERVRYYLSARALLGGNKSFHAFAAEVFRDRSPEIAARVLSDLAEARPDDAPLLRILARVLDGWNEPELAKLLLQRAIELSPKEPQSWREMILLDAKHGRAASIASIAKRIRTRKHDEDSEEIYAQIEENLARFERQRGGDVRVDPQNDLTVELMWDAGWSWVDIHITEPSGETVKWDYTESKAGGKFTGGYIFGFGPEIYTIRNAPSGNYRIDIDYYMSDATNVSLQTLAHVIVYARGRRGGLERREHFVVLQFDEEHRTLEVVRMD